MILRILNRFLFKRRTLRELSRAAWQKEMMADYSLNVVPDLEQLEKAEGERKSEAQKKIEELEISPSYNSRQERKALEKELEEIDRKIAKYKADQLQVKNESQVMRAQAAEIEHRREFIRQTFSAWSRGKN